MGPLTKLSVKVVDSLMVDELNTLVMDDYSPETGYYLLRGTRSRKPYFVDEKGTVMNVYEVLDDGPNGVGVNGALGYRLLGKDRWVAQGQYNGYHIYDMSGQKIKTVPHNHLGLFSMSVFYYQTTFHPFEQDGTAFMVGKEPNLFNPQNVDPQEEGAEYYKKANVIYRYNLDTEESETLESFPESWEPRVMGVYAGAGQPIVAYHEDKHEMALLPTIGNQLFIYDFSSATPVLTHTVSLSHKNRPTELPTVKFNAEDQFNDYPYFIDIRYVGEKILLVFNTRIPSDVMRQLRALSEEYYNLPEYKEATDQYVNSYYIVVEDGRQVGVVDKLPVPGVLDFGDSEGYFYVNDNVNPQRERDYNVFYKLEIE
ncbi:MAG TPA: hypothetical protein VK957_11390 [Lunatimonas sp.]|nr:hypothetical protein [Lunatimonas sp.]